MFGAEGMVIEGWQGKPPQILIPDGPLGRRPCLPGNWLVRHPASGSIAVLSSREFYELYEAAPEPKPGGDDEPQGGEEASPDPFSEVDVLRVSEVDVLRAHLRQALELLGEASEVMGGVPGSVAWYAQVRRWREDVAELNAAIEWDTDRGELKTDKEV